MLSCARATRGLRRPSPGLMARPGKSIAKQSEGRAGEKNLPVGGRVRKSRAVGKHLARPQGRRLKSSGRSMRAVETMPAALMKKEWMGKVGA
jgi:hypothetical protein